MNFLEQLEQEAAAGSISLYRFCTGVAEMFKVRAHEVAVMTLRHSMLQFAYPPELRNIGMIPLISSAQAAKTATSKRAEIFNNFVRVRHSSIFETVKINDNDPLTIQKLMSAPVLLPNGEVFGVIQVSRKGITPEAAGADFNAADLNLLLAGAKLLGKVSRQLQDRGVEPQRFSAQGA